MKNLDLSIENTSGEIKETLYEIIDYVEFQISSILTNKANSDLSGILNILRQIDSHINQSETNGIQDKLNNIRFIESRKYIIELFVRRMKYDGLRNDNMEIIHHELNELFTLI
ncbi:MAG: hypothetical protein V3575_06860 [Candidatus Absconditabacteria bacterium]